MIRKYLAVPVSCPTYHPANYSKPKNKLDPVGGGGGGVEEEGRGHSIVKKTNSVEYTTGKLPSFSIVISCI